MSHFRACLVLLLISPLAMGCGNGNASKLSKPAENVAWPELSALQSPDVAMGIFRAMQMKDFKTMKSNLVKPELEELVNKLEASTIPAQFASKAREDAKKKVVDDYKALIAAAKGVGSPNDLKMGGEAVMKSMGVLTDPGLK